MARRRRRRGRNSSEISGAASSVVILLLLLVGAFSELLRAPGWVLPLIGMSAILVTAGIIGLFIWLYSRRRRRWLAHVHTLGDLLALTPTQFELTIGELLARWGYQRVQHTGGGGDLAADLTCHTADGQLLVVQCKRYAPGNLIGSPEVQKFIGMLSVHHRAQLGIFVTTSSFTRPALMLAHQHNLRTIDGQELTQHIQGMRVQA